MKTFAARPLSLALGLVASAAGCNSRPPATVAEQVSKQSDPFEELAQSIRDDFRKPADAAVSRRVVEQVNNQLSRGGERRPAGLSAEDRSQLQKELGLRPQEVVELGRTEFTSVDAHYLDEVLLLRDIARSLDADRLPPLERSEAALAWVTRNLRAVPPAGPAVPISFLAMQGAGSPIERTYFLLALLRQLNLDAALIGDPGAKPDAVWAVGVLADGQVYLLDARLGLPLPGIAGKGVLTLEQARSYIEPFKPLDLDTKLPYDVSRDRAKPAEILVTAPLSALSPRMRFLQELVGDETTRLAADMATQAERFRKAAGGATVRPWCPPVGDAYPRLLYAFLPQAEGGGDTSSPGRLPIFYRSLVPLELLPQFLKELQGEPGMKILNSFRALTTGLDMPGQAHDLILRGQFREATEQLIGVQTQAKHRPGNPDELIKNTEDWAKAAREYAADAIRNERGGLDAAGLERMNQNRMTAERLWQSPRGPLVYLQFLTSDMVASHTTYLLGLCKHEEAERLASQPDVARPAWRTAQQWWRSFLNSYPTHPSAPAARRSLARALEAGGQRPAARAEYSALAESAPTRHEKLACRYLAEKLK
jgi:transglutaminase-like putative cysteine protease